MRFYRLLLRLLPASFRSEYGEQMCDVFAARRRTELPLVLWGRAIADVLRSATALHLELLNQDLHWTLRALARAPGFAVTALVLAALGTGVTMATFALLNHVLLRPLPFDDPNRLIMLFQAEPSFGTGRAEATPPNFEDWRSSSRSFSSMGAFLPVQVAMNLSGIGEPQRLESSLVSAAAFDTLGARPAVGRGFTSDDDAPEAADVVILSNALAMSLFGRASAALDQSVQLNDRAFSIVGVMPPGFTFPSRETDVWIPFRSIASPANLSDRRNHLFNVVARLGPGVTMAEAQAEMTTIARQLELAYPEANNGVGIEVMKMRDVMSPEARGRVIAVFAAAICLLFIACTNLAHLLVARTADRRQEIAVRVALGAGRERVLRQLLTESVVLAVVGGAAGVLLAIAAIPFLTILVPSSLPIGAAPALDGRVLVLAGALVMATSVAFAVGPAWRRAKVIDAGAMRVRAESSGPGMVRGALVLTQVTGTVVLLVAAGLLTKAMWRVQDVDPGFRADGVVTLQTALPVGMPVQARRNFHERVLSEVRTLPGVMSASYVSWLPMTFPAGNLPVTTPGVILAEELRAHIRFVFRDYFRTLRIPIVSGRDVRDSDTFTAPRVAVISESLAQTLWPGINPVGRAIELFRQRWEVVGVAGDVAVRGLEARSLPQMYLPGDQLPEGLGFYAPKDLVIRSPGNPTALLPAIRAIVREANPNLAIANAMRLEELVSGQTASRRALVTILAGFAAVAFLLASVGIYGLLAYAVSSRKQEIGVRMALGAARTQVMTMFLRQGVRLAVGGVLLAIPIAYAAARAMTALLFGVEPGDPLVFAAAALLVFLMTLAGSLGPAVRASGVDPVAVMRSD